MSYIILTTLLTTTFKTTKILQKKKMKH